MFFKQSIVDYQKINKTVYKTIIALKLNSLPISVDYISNQLSIKQIRNCDLNKSMLYPNQNGLVVLLKGKFYIIYNESDDFQERRFTVAHEIGHILLGHLFNKPLSKSEQKLREYEADIFATFLLAPVCVVQELKIQSPEQLQYVCNLPYQYAKNFFEYSSYIYSKDDLLTSFEYQVYKLFFAYICNYRYVI